MLWVKASNDMQILQFTITSGNLPGQRWIDSLTKQKKFVLSNSMFMAFMLVFSGFPESVAAAVATDVGTSISEVNVDFDVHPL